MHQTKLLPPFTERHAHIFLEEPLRFELGRRIGARPVAPQLRVLEHIMNQIFAETTNTPSRSKSN